MINKILTIILLLIYTLFGVIVYFINPKILFCYMPVMAYLFYLEIKHNLMEK